MLKGIEAAILMMLSAAVAFVIGISVAPQRPQKLQPHVFKKYSISFVNETMKPFSIQGDAIDRRDGCVLIFRGGEVDTIICAPVDKLIVSEEN